MKTGKLCVLVGICLFVLLSCTHESGRGRFKGRLVVTQDTPKDSSEIKVQPAKVRKKELSGTEIFARYNSAVFMVITSNGETSSQGSGFFVNSDGLGVSNYHVFEETTSGYEVIKLIDGRTFTIGEVIASSSEDDYIVFKVALDGCKVNCIPISNEDPIVGEKAYAIGTPQGLENTFSSGEISQIRDKNMLQISVPIDHGSSGGALLNRYGEVIGITTSGIGETNANLNFAKNINVIKKFLR